jgi:integrase
MIYDWVDHKLLFKECGEETAYINRSYTRNHIAPWPIAKRKVSRITAVELDEFYINLRKSGASIETCGTVMEIIKGAFKSAHRRGRLAQNVAASIKIISEEKLPLEPGRDLPTPEEAQRLIEGTPRVYRAFIVTALRTGMRPAELRGLNWGNVNFKDGLIQVRQSATVRGTIKETLKTNAGRRDIPMTKTLEKVLREHRVHSLTPYTGGHVGYRHVKDAKLARMYGLKPQKPHTDVPQYRFYNKYFDELEALAEAERWHEVRNYRYPNPSKSGYVARIHMYRDDLIAAHEYETNNVLHWTTPDPQALVFPNALGKPVHICTLQEWFDTAQTTLDMTKEHGEPKYSLYGMRHFYASWLLNGGIPPLEVKTYMGHKSIVITHDVYGHFFKNVEGARRRLDALEEASAAPEPEERKVIELPHDKFHDNDDIEEILARKSKS